MLYNFWTANPIYTSSHFDNIDWSEETNAFRSSEPNRNDCWGLAPPPRAQIGSNCHIFNQ